MVKTEVGVADAWVREGMTKAEADALIAQIVARAEAVEVSTALLERGARARRGQSRWKSRSCRGRNWRDTGEYWSVLGPAVQHFGDNGRGTGRTHRRTRSCDQGG